MKLILCTRDLAYGVGAHIRVLLREFDRMEEIEKILVIGPEKLKGLGNKIDSEILKTRGRYFVTKQPLFAIECRNRIEKALRAGKYDLIHTHYPVIAKRFAVPLVTTFHTLNYFSATGYPADDYTLKVGNLFHRIYEIFDKSTIIHSSKVIFVSNEALNAARSRYRAESQKFVFIPNFVDTSAFSPVDKSRRISLREKYGLSQEKRYVIFVGRLDPLKGIPALVKAIRKSREKYKNLELLVVGDGPLREEISKFDFVRCLGRIAYEKMNEIYNVSDLLVLPSFYENFPMSILEAMSCGLPVIATDVGSVRLIVNNDRMLMETPNANRILEKIRAISDLPEEKIREIGEKNRSYVMNRFDSKNAHKILKTYVDVTADQT